VTGLIQSIRGKYSQTLDRIAAAARSVGRDPDTVKLVVVTKAQPVEIVQAAIQAGVKMIGENYAEEGVMKIQSVGEASGVEWHMIGHVQSRKAELVARHFNMLQSLDSLRLARRLDRFCTEAGHSLPVLLEFNVGDEASKAGWPAADERRWSNLLPDISSILELPSLEVRGLMAMPPLGGQAESSRPYFVRLRKLQHYLSNQLPSGAWAELSMGTSLDYEVAVEESATLVRIGTAIVGARPD